MGLAKAVKGCTAGGKYPRLRDEGYIVIYLVKVEAYEK
jgi:hypothetical protein